MNDRENSLERGRRQAHAAGNQRRRMLGVRSPSRDAVQLRLRNRPGMALDNHQSSRPEASERKIPQPPTRPARQQPARDHRVENPGRLSAEVRQLVDSFASMKASVPKFTGRNNQARPDPHCPSPRMMRRINHLTKSYM